MEHIIYRDAGCEVFYHRDQVSIRQLMNDQSDNVAAYTMLWILFVPDLLQYMSMPYQSLGPQGLSELLPPCSCVRGRSDYCISHTVDDFLCRTVSDSEACGTR